MPAFAWEARDLRGRRVRGAETALDERDLDARLAGRELVLVRARAARGRGRGRVGTRALIDFCYHLGTVVEAGLPLLAGLRDLRDGADDALGDVLEDLARQIESGASLSAAMAEHPRAFPELVRSLVGAGEETGQLDRVLRDLVRHLQWREDLRRKVIAASTYPVLVVAGISGLLALITLVVLPNFVAVFVELGAELPLLTRALLGVQAFLARHGVLVLAALAAALAGLVAASRHEQARRELDAVMLRLPLVGPLVRMLETSRFAHNMALLYSSGIPIVRALQLVALVVQNRIVREGIAGATERIRQGETLSASLRAGEILPRLVLRMVELGESSGRLDQSLEHAAAYFDREVPARIDRLVTIVNAGAVVTLGVVLGAVALGIFVPLYSVMGNLNASQ